MNSSKDNEPIEIFYPPHLIQYNQDEDEDDEHDKKNQEKDQEIIMQMDTIPEYFEKFKGQTKTINLCKGLFEILDNINLCFCERFDQYCITFENRSRIFTVIGELHHSILLDQNYFMDKCRNSLLIDQYISYINIGNQQVDKNLAIFLELSLNQNPEYYSNNIWRILQFNNYLKSEKSQPLLNISNVDIRYIGQMNQKIYPKQMMDSLFTQQGNFESLTLKDLRENIKENSYLKKFLLYLLNRFLTFDSKYELSKIYDSNHLLLLKRFYDRIIDQLNQINYILHYYFEKYKDFVKISTLSNTELNSMILEIRDKYLYCYTSTVDLYTLIQVFRKDYPYDNVILLIGDAHAFFISQELEEYNIISRKKDIDGIINLKGTFF
jgi:hypothetical protein